ncbi:putative calcium/calmodulin dependent protein kinase [Aspergillus campestris IBT 28561]|uniref:Calcium/calmodulin dependent protein kinase n=1 Tax=Aspergillus campestris (strain IBT 28561) TaxID=1392248 RepID=A0A2I1CUS1_ASPC2|nr:putative calcium/calmodulin dependent protein kinase [Aspergillus campestris IBT 28561]PKY01354.1 putative calcium/calmodulin dependent protein kinase [Aspergillus campestris IBT 28561]
MFRGTVARMASARKELIGTTGRRYEFKSLIQERPHLGRVWLAKSGPAQFILKDVPEDIFSNFNERIQPQLNKSPYIRLPHDAIPGERVLVYKYLKDDFLDLVRREIPMRARKKILKASLLGIAELHDKNVVHLDIKPDNIMVDSYCDRKDGSVERVQLIDLENAAYLPKGRCIKGMLAGNDNWRSPEAHFKGELNKPTDIFSFGIVCIYAVLGRVIFGPDEDFEKHHAQGALPIFIRLQRQVSYFGDPEGINGLSKHLADDEFGREALQMLWDERLEEHIPYRPFAEWPEITDPDFKDLISGLTNLDPAKRITARQALAHPWLAGI